MPNDEARMTKETRNPNPERARNPDQDWFPSPQRGRGARGKG